MNWRNVLDCKIWVGDIARMCDAARSVGYEFFLWNDRVYCTGDGKPTAWLVRDDALVEDIPGFERWLRG